MADLWLVPEDSTTKHALATALSCWARDARNMTDPAVQYLTCCKNGYFKIPGDLCDTYGPLPVTSNGATITCPDTDPGMKFYVITDADVTLMDPTTCEAVERTATPTGLAVDGTPTTTQIDLTWTAVDGASGYTVRYRQQGTAEWTTISVTTETTQSVTGLTADTTYEFQVKASSPGAADSQWSASVTGATAAA